MLEMDNSFSRGRITAFEAQMTLAAVLPQVVGALRAFDPYERGVALNQLAQVCELSFAPGGQLHNTPAHLCRLVVACPGACSPGPPLHGPCMRTHAYAHRMAVVGTSLNLT